MVAQPWLQVLQAREGVTGLALRLWTITPPGRIGSSLALLLGRVKFSFFRKSRNRSTAYVVLLGCTVNCLKLPKRLRIAALSLCVEPSRTLLGIPKARARAATPPTGFVSGVAVRVDIPPEEL